MPGEVGWAPAWIPHPMGGVCSSPGSSSPSSLWLLHTPGSSRWCPQWLDVCRSSAAAENMSHQSFPQILFPASFPATLADSFHLYFVLPDLGCYTDGFRQYVFLCLVPLFIIGVSMLPWFKWLKELIFCNINTSIPSSLFIISYFLTKLIMVIE